jgi:hypothetical protein
MNREEKHIARVKFQNKLLSSDKQAYEDLFTKVMQLYDLNFQPIKPHGKEGDKKCDGFNKTTGQYYQVYAPEDLDGKEKTALDKLESTIIGLFEYWQSISPIKEFYYVIKDDYKGAYPSLHLQLANIKRMYKIEKADVFLCKDLENILLQLSDDDVIEILGGILPNVANLTNIDVSSLGEVIVHLLNSERKPKEERFPDDPNFDKKIRFNNLSDEYASQLKSAYLQTYIIDEYFTYQGSFLKQDLKLVFSEFYSNSQVEVPEAIENRSDIIFEKIWDKASPNNKIPYRNASLVLMSHYFESCDIFEEPIEPTQQNLFE